MFTKLGNVIHRNKRFQNSSPALQLKNILNLEAKRNLNFPFEKGLKSSATKDSV